jgi:hypothetical protein
MQSDMCCKATAQWPAQSSTALSAPGQHTTAPQDGPCILASAVAVLCPSAYLPPGKAFFEEVRTQLSSATELSAPASKAAIMAMTAAAGRNGRSSSARPRVRMFVSLDFEWWEKSSDTILEVGWSLWDTVTQRHRTRHWIIRDNLNKVSTADPVLCWCSCGWCRTDVAVAQRCNALQHCGPLDICSTWPCTMLQNSQHWACRHVAMSVCTARQLYTTAGLVTCT